MLNYLKTRLDLTVSVPDGGLRIRKSVHMQMSIRRRCLKPSQSPSERAKSEISKFIFVQDSRDIFGMCSLGHVFVNGSLT